jgi:putative ABC transport system permease protein
MLKHLFKMIWNKKKQNSLLLTEMLISFLVMFGVLTLLVYNYRNYKKPMGFDYENVWGVSYNNSLKTNSADSLVLFYENLKQIVKTMPQVLEVSYTNNMPLSQSTNQTGIKYKNIQAHQVNLFFADETYNGVLGMKILEGRWFNKQDNIAKKKPAIINRTLKEELFGKDNALGKTIGDDKQVIGVVEDAKFKGDYTVAGNALFIKIDTASFHWLGNIIIKVTPDADAAFEGRLYKTMAGIMKNTNLEIEHLTAKRISRNNFSIIPMVILLIVSLFLIINVALGLFGVLWYNINKRRGEIGLRRAIGASGKSVSWQLVAEAMVLATLSIIAGSFLAVQFPLLNVFDLPAGVYLTAMLLSMLFIYALVFVCSLYPGKQAAAIYPAVALHED